MTSSTMARDPNDGDDSQQDGASLAEQAAQLAASTPRAAYDPMNAIYTRARGADTDVAVFMAYRYFDGALRPVLVQRHGYISSDHSASTHERFYFEIDLPNNHAIQVPDRATRADLLALRHQYGMSSR